MIDVNVEKTCRDGQVEQLNTEVQLVGATPHSHEPGFGYALYPRDHALVSTCHLLLAIRRRSNNHLAPVRVESVHCLDKRVEDNLAHMPVIDRDEQEVGVINSAFMTDADADIAVRGRHVCRHGDRDRERPALPQKLQDSL